MQTIDWFLPSPNLLAWSVAMVNVAKNVGFVASASSPGAFSDVARITGVPSRSVTIMHKMPFILWENWTRQCKSVLICFDAFCCPYFCNNPLKYLFISSVMIYMFSFFKNKVKKYSISWEFVPIYIAECSAMCQIGNEYSFTSKITYFFFLPYAKVITRKLSDADRLLPNAYNS